MKNLLYTLWVGVFFSALIFWAMEPHMAHAGLEPSSSAGTVISQAIP